MQLRLFYFLYYGAVGITLGYLPSYLRSLGLSGSQVAVAVSVQSLFTILVPLGWGYAADRSGAPVRLLRLASFGAAASYPLLLAAGGFGQVLSILALHSLFVTAIIALADGVAVVEAKKPKGDYAKIRLWGSLGFAVAAWCFGLWLGSGGAISSAIVVAALIMGAYWLIALTIREEGRSEQVQRPALRDVGSLVRRPELIIFFAAAALHYGSLAPYHVFFAIHLGDLGISPSWVGVGFAAAVLTEIGVMWGSRGILTRAPLGVLLAASSGIGALRLLLTGLAESGLAIATIQSLHGFGFGLFFVGSIAYLEQEVPPMLRATGRAIFSALAFGVGGMGGNLIAGTLYDLGGGRLAFLTCAAIDLLAVALFLTLPRLSAAPVQATQSVRPMER